MRGNESWRKMIIWPFFNHLVLQPSQTSASKSFFVTIYEDFLLSENAILKGILRTKRLMRNQKLLTIFTRFAVLLGNILLTRYSTSATHNTISKRSAASHTAMTPFIFQVAHHWYTSWSYTWHVRSNLRALYMVAMVSHIVSPPQKDTSLNSLLQEVNTN